MLTYADVCRRMLTYADVCRRMQTYADVCTSSQASKAAELGMSLEQVLKKKKNIEL
jgi:hypothetical protein